jgi:hypothetical protein
MCSRHAIIPSLEALDRLLISAVDGRAHRHKVALSSAYFIGWSGYDLDSLKKIDVVFYEN